MQITGGFAQIGLQTLLILDAFAGRGFRGRALGEVAGAKVELKLLEVWIHQLDLNLAI